MLGHLRNAVRILAKSPGLTVVAATTLALGIGANTAIFTVANALLLRPLPYADPERLALISAPPSDRRDTGGLLSYPFFTLLRDRNRSFSGVAASTFEILQPEQPRRSRAGALSPRLLEFFPGARHSARAGPRVSARGGSARRERCRHHQP
jgi:hypothetical protein